MKTRINKIIDEQAVSLKNDYYITKISGASSSKIGLITSNSYCEIYTYDDTSLKKNFKFTDTEGTISDIQFCPMNDSLIYTGSTNGTIKLWDSRTNNEHVAKFEENPDTRQFTKPLNALDVSCDGRILCGGTELTEGDSYILFWDVRGKQLLGGYWNSHTDDIVQVKFCPEKANKLISGSVDGLVNVYDISEQTEDDALQYSLNIDCAVDKINWMSHEVISCLTQNIDVQFWNVSTADQLNSFTRENISNHLLNNNSDDCYVADIHRNSCNIPVLITGSYDSNRSSLNLSHVANKTLTLKSNFEGNKQVVRCSWYDFKNDILICGGEKGVLSLWRDSDESSIESNIIENSHSVSLSSKKNKEHRSKPY